MMRRWSLLRHLKHLPLNLLKKASLSCDALNPRRLVGTMVVQMTAIVRGEGARGLVLAGSRARPSFLVSIRGAVDYGIGHYHDG